MDIIIRKASIEDSDYIFNLINEKTTVDVSFSQKAITRKEHERWYPEAIRSNEVLYFIIEHEETGESVGQLRVNVEGTISLTISEKYRGLRLASASILKLANYLETNSELPDLTTIHAYIRSKNVKSTRTFLRVGFKKTGVTHLYGHECVIYSLSLNR